MYILNRLPTRALTGQTPYEAWSNRKTDVSHIRVFGCLAHMKNPSVNTQKLDDRSKRVVNLGKELGTKGYHLYDPESNRVYINRDVVFEELKPWTWSQSASEDDMSMQFSVLNVHEPDGEDQVDHDNQDETGEDETFDSGTYDTDGTGGTLAPHSSEG